MLHSIATEEPMRTVITLSVVVVVLATVVWQRRRTRMRLREEAEAEARVRRIERTRERRGVQRASVRPRQPIPSRVPVSRVQEPWTTSIGASAYADQFQVAVPDVVIEEARVHTVPDVQPESLFGGGESGGGGASESWSSDSGPSDSGSSSSSDSGSSSGGSD